MKKKKNMRFEKKAGAPSLNERELADDLKDFIEYKIIFGEKMAREKFTGVSTYRLKKAQETEPYQQYEKLYTELHKRAMFEGSAGLIKKAQAAAIKELERRFGEKIKKDDPQYVVKTEILMDFFNSLTGLLVIQPSDTPLKGMLETIIDKPLIENKETEVLEDDEIIDQFDDE